VAELYKLVHRVISNREPEETLRDRYECKGFGTSNRSKRRFDHADLRPISDRSSGSPVLNDNGELIGMVWGGDPQNDAHGLNYGVPRDILKRDLNIVVEKLGWTGQTPTW
jgi:S1-C subfamily serine protease